MLLSLVVWYFWGVWVDGLEFGGLSRLSELHGVKVRV